MASPLPGSPGTPQTRSLADLEARLRSSSNAQQAALTRQTADQLAKLAEAMAIITQFEAELIARVPAEDLLAGAFDPALLGADDWILVDGPAAETEDALERLLAVHPAHRTLAFLDAAACAKWGVAQAVRSGS